MRKSFAPLGVAGVRQTRSPRTRCASHNSAREGLDSLLHAGSQLVSVRAMEIGTPYDSPTLGTPPGAEKGPGRPAMSVQQRASADRKYAMKEALLNLLPASTKECRLKIFDAQDERDAKRSFESIGSILTSEYEQEGFGSEPEKFGSYLENKYGSGRYCIEAYDPLGNRITDIPSFFVATAGEDMNDDQEPRRRRRPARELDEEYGDDEDQRVNTPDVLATVAKANSLQAMQASKQQTDMFAVMMMQSQTASASKAEEERRREEREERRAEERRREMKDEREAERIRADQRDKEAREERQRDDDRRREERDRHTQELRATTEAASKRMEAIVSLAVAALPVVAKLFEKRDDPIQAAMIARLGQKAEPDQMQIMIFKSVLDKMSNDQGASNLIAQMGEMQKMMSTASGEQMRSMMSQSNEFQQMMMKKAIELAIASPGGEEKKPMLGQLMEALGSAAEIVKTLAPAAGTAPPQPLQQHPQPRQRIAQQPGQAAVAPGAAPGQPAPAPEAAPTGPTIAPGIPSVMTALQTLHMAETDPKARLTQVDYQSVMRFLLENMPLDLRVAVIEGNQQGVMQLALPYVQASESLSAWINGPGTMPWLMAYVPQLTPNIVAMFGPAEAQVAQLRGGAPAQSAPADEAPALVPDQTPEPLAVDPNGVVTEVINGPGSEQRSPAAEPEAPAAEFSAPITPAATSGSHLDPNEP